MEEAGDANRMSYSSNKTKGKTKEELNSLFWGSFSIKTFFITLFVFCLLLSALKGVTHNDRDFRHFPLLFGRSLWPLVSPVGSGQWRGESGHK